MQNDDIHSHVMETVSGRTMGGVPEHGFQREMVQKGGLWIWLIEKLIWIRLTVMLKKAVAGVSAVSCGSGYAAHPWKNKLDKCSCCYLICPCFFWHWYWTSSRGHRIGLTFYYGCRCAVGWPDILQVPFPSCSCGWDKLFWSRSLSR